MTNEVQKPSVEPRDTVLAEIELTTEQKEAIATASGGLQFSRISVRARPADLVVENSVGRLTLIELMCW